MILSIIPKTCLSNLLMLLILSALHSHCYGDFSALQFKKYNTTNSSLPNNTAFHVTEDHKGFIWVGTDSGLRRFDGIDFESLAEITGNPETSLLDVAIKQLLFDADKNLWIATLYDGVYRLNTQSYQLSHFNERNGLTKGYVRRIVEDHNSNIWIATREGINKFDLSTEDMTPVDKEIFAVDNKGIYSFEYSQSDNWLWVGTGQGITQFDITSPSTRIIGKKPAKKLLSKAVTYIHSDGKNKLWLGTKNSLLNYDREKQNYYPMLIQGDRNLNYIFSISSDSNNRLWVGTKNELLVFDTISNKLLWSMPTTISEGDENKINHIYISPNNQLWLATDKGLWKANLSSLAFIEYSTNNKNHSTIKNNTVYAIFEDPEGNPLIATKGKGIDYLYKSEKPSKGLTEIETKNTDLHSRKADHPHTSNYSDDLFERNNNWKNYSTSSFTKDKVERIITSISGDNKGNLWLSIENEIIQYNLMSKGIIHFSENNYKHPNNNKSEITSIFYDSEQRLWILYRPYWLSYINMQTGESKIFERNDLSNQDIKIIYETKDNEILLVTNKSLMIYKQETGEFIEHPIVLDNLSNLVINSIAELPKNDLWLGTDYGLIKYNINGKKTEHYTVDDRLSHNIIVDIQTDNNDNLWLATYEGLSKFYYPTKQFDNFYYEDGLPDNEFDSGTSFKSNTGKLYFAGPKGVIYFNPNEIKINKNSPAIEITKFKIKGKAIYDNPNKEQEFNSEKIANVENITLNYRENDFSVKFSALDYHHPEKNQYKYKLAGYDKEWRNTDYTNRIANYSNLPDDTYTLILKASNNHGAWNEKGRQISITILPPPWKTWWAYTLYILLSILSLWALYAYRTRKLHQRALLLEQQVNEQTKEITQQNKDLEKKNKKVSEQSKEIIQNNIELEEKNKQVNELIKTKDQIFANISHELKTPLTLITAPLKAITRKAREKSEAEELGMIQRNAYRLLRMVDQLLELSKLQNAKQAEINDDNLASYVPLHKLIKATAPFKRIADEKDINFGIKENEHAFILCQQELLEKIIFNLTSNAMKYTLEGEVSISSQWHDDKTVAVKFNDTGLGIPEDKINTIFDRFTRVHDVENQRKTIAGAGIGLCLVKEIVESLSGNIEVKTTLGEGSEFTIYLPAVKEKNLASGYNLVYLESVEIASIEIAQFSNEMQQEFNRESDESINRQNQKDNKKYTILIIDDNADIRQYVAKILKHDYKTLTAQDGEVGIKIAESEIPDLIISDVMMPEVDGFGVCQYLKSNKFTCHIPIILLTALHDRDSRLKALELYRDAYITKPFDPDELIKEVQRLLTLPGRFAESLNNNINILTDPTIDIPDKDREFIAQFNDYIASNYKNEKLTVSVMAVDMEIQKHTLERKLKALMNVKPGTYLRTYRLQIAESLLVSTNLSIQKIADECGFSDASTFSRAFNNHYKLSPTPYRNMKSKPKSQFPSPLTH